MSRSRVSLPTGGDGILPVDKPEGPTSHDVVADVRRILDVRRVGHTGTLDPFASGLLLVCVGRATRLAEYLHPLPKDYVAEARLGQVTSTLDPEGELVRDDPGWAELDEDGVRGALQQLLGPQNQRPPSYSAKKVDGERAYRRARRGEALKLPPVPVEIHELELIELALPLIRFRVRCSTGTYVRALARDLGEHLGVGAHLTALRRTAIGDFQADEAPDPEGLAGPGVLEAAWISPLEAVAHLPRVEVDEAEARRLTSGQSLPVAPDAAPEFGPTAVVAGGELLAVAEPERGQLRPRKVFPRG